MIKKKGQSIVEVVIATALISIGVLAALALTNQSQKSSTYAKLLDTASAYNNQLADFFRHQKNTLGWATITEKILSDGSLGITTYCFPSIPPDFSTLSPGPCIGTEYIDTTPFLRQATIDTSSLGSGSLLISITTTWTDKVIRNSTLKLELTKW